MTDNALAGPASATAVLMDEHLPLVVHLVRETMARVPSPAVRDDLLRAALDALHAAARDLDADQRAAFAGPATARIRAALVDELRAVDWEALSDHRELHVAAARARLRATVDALPAGVAAAAALDLCSDEEHVAVADLAPQVPPTPVPVSVPGPAGVDLAERLGQLAAAVDELPRTLRTIVVDYFVAARPVPEIAGEIGISPARVSELRTEALVLLRNQLEDAAQQPRTTPTTTFPDVGQLAGRRTRELAGPRVELGASA